MILGLSISVNAATIVNNQKINEESQDISLQDTKTNLEIDKLESDIKNSNNSTQYQPVTVICTAATVIISLLTMFFTTVNQIRTFKMQTKQNREQQMTNYLSQLSSNDKTIKIGAIQALGSYEEALPYIVNVLKSEDDYFVISAVTTTVVKNAEKSLKILINESKSIRSEKVKLAGEFLALNESEKEIIKLLLIDDKEYKEWKQERLFNEARLQLIHKMDICLKMQGSTREDIYLKEKDKLLSKLYLLENLLKELINITEATIRNLAQSRKVSSVEGAYLPTIKLSDLSLNDWNFSKADLTNAKLERCIFDHTIFEDSILKNASFRDGSFKNIKFEGNLSDNCDFSKCRIEGVEFNNIKANCISFKGSKLINCKFKKCVCYESKLNGIKLENVEFSNTKLFRADLMNAEINNKNIFNNVEFNGSRFDGAKSINTEYNNCKMIAVKLNKSIYKNCKLKNIEFRNIKVYDASIFKSNKYHQVVFGPESEEFREYIRAQNEIINLDITNA